MKKRSLPEPEEHAVKRQQQPRYYKLLAADLRHYDFQYKVGLNEDTQPFRPNGHCRPGGLYFTDLAHIGDYAYSGWPLVADVTLPADARVYPEPDGTKWKADRIVLSNIRPISEFLAELSEPDVVHLVRNNWWLFSQLKQQTESICIAVMQRRGDLLSYVHHQTEAICLAAVRSCWQALRLVRDQTPAICMTAVLTHGCAIQYATNKTPELMQAAGRGCIAHRVKNPFI